MKQGLWTLLEELQSGYSGQNAFSCEQDGGIRNVSYPGFLTHVKRLALFYRQWEPTRIGLWGGNSYAWVVAAAALLLAGKEVILLDAGLSDEELLRLAEYTDVEAVLADEELMEDADTVRKKLVMEPMRLAGAAFAESDSGKVQAPGSCPEADFSSGPEGNFICFTSGTSKSAKGAVISTESLYTCVKLAEGVLPGKSGERYFLPLPFHHIYAFTEIFHILKRGGTLCIGRGGRYLGQDMELFSPNVAFLVPSMLRYLLDKEKLPEELHSVLTGGSYLEGDLIREMNDRRIDFYNLYGLSETLGMICGSTKEKGMLWLAPFGGIRFVLSENQEIGVYLPFHMREYYKKPEETMAVLDPQTGLFWTGDAGALDVDGCIRIKGRLRDTIVLENGEKIHAEDVDGELSQLAGENAAEAAVVSLNGKLWAVFVTEGDDRKRKLEQAVNRYNKKKSVYTRISGIHCRREKLPRTATGKLQRFKLEAEYK